jgi:hypothetical protein
MFRFGWFACASLRINANARAVGDVAPVQAAKEAKARAERAVTEVDKIQAVDSDDSDSDHDDSGGGGGDRSSVAKVASAPDEGSSIGANARGSVRGAPTATSIGNGGGGCTDGGGEGASSQHPTMAPAGAAKQATTTPLSARDTSAVLGGRGGAFGGGGGFGAIPTQAADGARGPTSTRGAAQAKPVLENGKVLHGLDMAGGTPQQFPSHGAHQRVCGLSARTICFAELHRTTVRQRRAWATAPSSCVHVDAFPRTVRFTRWNTVSRFAFVWFKLALSPVYYLHVAWFTLALAPVYSLHLYGSHSLLHLSLRVDGAVQSSDGVGFGGGN